MTASGKSLFYFGIYAVIAGLVFLILPGRAIPLLRLPTLTDGWARSIGLLALVIGAYDMVSARANLQPFIRASVYVRLGFLCWARLYW